MMRILILAFLALAACGEGRDHFGVELPNGNSTLDAGSADDAGGNACDCPQGGLVWNGVEYCIGVGECAHTGDLCQNGMTCDESRNECVGPPTCVGCPETCEMDLDCNDGLFCNGAERCLDGECRPGEPPACNDPFVCTVGVCVEGTGCFQVPDSTICNEGEFCSTSSGCTPEPTCPTCPLGTPDAGVPECDAPPSCAPLVCDDEDACNGVWAQNPDTCLCDQVAPPLGGCDDGDSCTTDSCDATLGCQHELVVCDDGYSCVAGECTCHKPEPECSGHSDCPSDKRKCLDGTCVQCYEEWHCTLYTALPCGDSCPPSPYCAAGANTCVYP